MCSAEEQLHNAASHYLLWEIPEKSRSARLLGVKKKKNNCKTKSKISDTVYDKGSSGNGSGEYSRRVIYNLFLFWYLSVHPYV